MRKLADQKRGAETIVFTTPLQKGNAGVGGWHLSATAGKGEKRPTKGSIGRAPFDREILRSEGEGSARDEARKKWRKL